MRRRHKRQVARCQCDDLGITAILNMGDESEAVFRTFDEMKKRGMPYWWLAAYQCRACGQWWLVAQEERQNDIFCLHRLTAKEVERLIHYNDWPEDFDDYATLLEMGAEAGITASFLDPLHSSQVVTMTDLARAHPGIPLSSIANLLTLDMETAAAIAEIVVQQFKVEIDFSS